MYLVIALLFFPSCISPLYLHLVSIVHSELDCALPPPLECLMKMVLQVDIPWRDAMLDLVHKPSLLPPSIVSSVFGSWHEPAASERPPVLSKVPSFLSPGISLATHHERCVRHQLRYDRSVSLTVEAALRWPLEEGVRRRRLFHQTLHHHPSPFVMTGHPFSLVWPRSLVVNALFFVPSTRGRRYVQVNSMEFGPRSLYDWTNVCLSPASSNDFYIIFGRRSWSTIPPDFRGIVFGSHPPSPWRSGMHSILVSRDLAVTFVDRSIPSFADFHLYSFEHYLSHPIMPCPLTLHGDLPSIVMRWRHWSGHCPDRLSSAAVNGFLFGRSIRYDGRRGGFRRRRNYPMSEREESFTHRDTCESVADGRLEQILPNTFSAGSCHPRFVSSNSSGKMRLIVDPIFVNPSIAKREDPVKYSSFASAEQAMLSSGRYSIFIKFDIPSAYNRVGVATFDIPLLLEEWRGTLLCKRTQQWGVRSAGDNWLEPASVLASIIFAFIAFCMFYVDDYCILVKPSLGAPDWHAAAVALRRLLWLLPHLGFERVKKWGVFTSGQYLGMGLCSRSLRAFLPEERRMATIAFIMRVFRLPL